MFYFLLGILMLAEGASLYLKGRSFVFKYLFIGTIILIFGLLFYQSYQQYQLFSESSISKFLLPPYHSIGYFLGYIFIHFFQKYLISLGASILFLIAAVLLNNRFQKRFFEDGELFLGALALFAMGHPLWMYYFILVMIIGVLGSLFLIIKAKIKGVKEFSRFPFYYVWVPAAIILAVIGKRFGFF